MPTVIIRPLKKLKISDKKIHACALILDAPDSSAPYLFVVDALGQHACKLTNDSTPLSKRIFFIPLNDNIKQASYEFADNKKVINYRSNERQFVVESLGFCEKIFVFKASLFVICLKNNFYAIRQHREFYKIIRDSESKVQLIRCENYSDHVNGILQSEKFDSNKNKFIASADGQYFCVVNNNKTINVYTFQAREEGSHEALSAIEDNGYLVLGASFSEDGGFLAICHDDNKCRIYFDFDNFKDSILDFEIEASNVSCCGFLNQNRVFFIGDETGQIYFYSTEYFYAVRIAREAQQKTLQTAGRLTIYYEKLYSDTIYNDYFGKFNIYSVFFEAEILENIVNFESNTTKIFKEPPANLHRYLRDLPYKIYTHIEFSIRPQNILNQFSEDVYGSSMYDVSTPEPSFGWDDSPDTQTAEATYTDIEWPQVRKRLWEEVLNCFNKFKNYLLWLACDQLLIEHIETLLQQRASLFEDVYPLAFSQRKIESSLQRLSGKIFSKGNQLQDKHIELLKYIIRNALENAPDPSKREICNDILGNFAYIAHDFTSMHEYFSKGSYKSSMHFRLGKSSYEGHSSNGRQNIVVAIRHLMLAKKARNKAAISYIEERKEKFIKELITCLLYRHSRGYAENDQINQEILDYIGCLDEERAGKDIVYYAQYIRQCEQAQHSYFGADLSDDSDDEEEEKFVSNSSFVSEPVKIYYKDIADRAEVDKLKKELHSILSENFKLEKKIKTVFAPRNRRPISESVDDYIVRELARLNAFNARGNLLEGIHSISTKFIVAQFRGITYSTCRWSADQRRRHRSLNEINRPLFSDAVYKAERLNPGAVEPGDYARLTQRAIAIQKQLVELRKSSKVNFERYINKSKTQVRWFETSADFLHQQYTTDYDRFQEALAHVCPSLATLGNPYVSTGDTPFHALKYAYGVKPYKSHRDERLSPRWNSEQRAERPHVGKLYLSLHPLKDYADDNAPSHITSLNTSGRVEIDVLISQERETTFLGYIPDGRVKLIHHAKYPSFGDDYRSIYYYKYGLDQESYLKFQEGFRKYAPHTQGYRCLKYLLGEYLCAFHEVRLIEKAKELAKEQGAILIYRDEYGQFCLQPPLNVVPTKGSQPYDTIQQQNLKRVREGYKKSLDEPGVRTIVRNPEGKFSERNELTSKQSNPSTPAHAGVVRSASSSKSSASKRAALVNLLEDDSDD